MNDQGSARPKFTLIGHYLHAVRLNRSEVICLYAVVGQVIPFPIVVTGCYQFPVANSDGAVAFVLPGQRSLPKRSTAYFRPFTRKIKIPVSISNLQTTWTVKAELMRRLEGN